MMLPLLLLGFLCVAGDAPPSTETSESVFKRYDLVAHGGQHTRYGNGEVLFPGCAPDQDWESFPDQYFAPEDIEETLRMFLEKELEYEGRHYSVDERGQMSLLAPESVHQRVSRILSALAQATAIQSELQVDILTVPPGSDSLPPGTIALEDVDRELQRYAKQITESYTLPLRPGLRSVLNALSSEDLLADFDVEVAQNSAAFDPLITTLLTGTRLQVEASPSRDGCNLAMLYWNGSSARETQEHSFNLASRIHTERGFAASVGPGSVQSAAIAQRTLALNTLIPRGRALVLRLGISLDENRSEQRMLIRLKGDLCPPVQSTDLGNGQRLHMVRRDTFAPARLNIFGAALSPDRPTQRLQERVGEYSELLYAAFREDQPDFEFNLLREALGETDWSDSQHWFLSFETEARHAANKKILHRLVNSMQPRGELIQVTVQLEEGNGQGQQALTLDLPLRIGTPSAALIGVESTSIRDFDVETAQGSSVLEPIGYFELNGAILHLLPTRSADGTLQIRVRLAAQLRRDQRMLSSADATFDRLQLSSFDHLALDQVIQFGPGQPTAKILGNGAANGGKGSLRLRVSVAASGR